MFGSKSLGDRTTSWSDRFDQIVDNPFGTGIGTTGAAADQIGVAQEHRTETSTFQPDNSYLKVTFELGVIGLWLLVMMLVSMFLYHAIGRAQSLGHRPSTSSPASPRSSLAIMAASLVATYLELVPMDQLFWS